MLHPLPDDPEPTEAEVQEELASIEPGPDDVRRIFARMQWRDRKLQQDPDAFRVPFATQFPGYNAYMDSSKWRRIRKKVLEAAGNKCACCSREAEEVHHRDYRPRVINGKDLTPLVPICSECHKRVHEDEEGDKRVDWNESERILAAMVARNAAQ